MAKFELIRKPKSPKVQHSIIRNEIQKRLKPVADSAVKSREQVVANWSSGSKPKFKNEVAVTTKKIEIIVVVRRGQRLPNSDATTADLWKWIDETGTRPHVIRPKKSGGRLAFIAGNYQAKTGARPARFGGPGRVVNGKPVFAKQVQHPGFPPREFSEAINRDLRKEFDKAVDAGYKAGFRKVTR